MQPEAIQCLPGTGPLLVLLHSLTYSSQQQQPLGQQDSSLLSISKNTLLPRVEWNRERVRTNDSKRKLQEGFSVHLSISLNTPRKAWPYSKRYLRLRGRLVVEESRSPPNLDVNNLVRCRPLTIYL